MLPLPVPAFTSPALFCEAVISPDPVSSEMVPIKPVASMLPEPVLSLEFWPTSEMRISPDPLPALKVTLFGSGDVVVDGNVIEAMIFADADNVSGLVDRRIVDDFVDSLFGGLV